MSSIDVPSILQKQKENEKNCTVWAHFSTPLLKRERMLKHEISLTHTPHLSVFLCLVWYSVEI